MYHNILIVKSDMISRPKLLWGSCYRKKEIVYENTGKIK